MSSLILDPRIVDLLAHDLQSGDPEVREASLDRLGVCFGDHTNLIAASLNDPVPEVRGSAAANLGGLRQPHAWRYLVQAVREDPSDEVRRHAVLALEGYSDHAILVVLLEVLGLRQQDYRIRLCAVRQIWKYDPAVVAPSLQVLMMSDDHPLVRLHAADSLELIDELLPFEPSRQGLWQRLSEDEDVGISNIATKALHRTTNLPAGDLADLLFRRLHGSDSNERSIALGRLPMLAPDSAAALIKPLLDDHQPEVRVECCSCLGTIRYDAAIPLLLAVLRSDPESRVQSAALAGLGNYHTVEIGEALLDMLEAEYLTGEARSFLCGQLWKYPSNRTVSLLRRALDSAQPMSHREHVESAFAFLHRLGLFAQ